MANQTQAVMEVFHAGDTVRYSGEYVLVDEQGNKRNYAIVTLDEGETFPQARGKILCYMLNDTCLEEACEIIGEETFDLE